MKTYLVAVHLLVEAGPQPRAAIHAALHDLLGEAMRQKAGPRSILIDWAVAGDDLAASIAPVDLSTAYSPDETPFPEWPASQAGRMRLCESVP